MVSGGEHVERLFPGLRGKAWKITSLPESQYNCIAWSASDTAQWWWPGDPADGYYWPEGVEKAETLAAFIAAYALMGYAECVDSAQEPGYEKIALFATPDGIPTHAARQLPNGRWTSKLGRLEDIEHELLDVCGQIYGSVVKVVRRLQPTGVPTE
jgi:hypothetical protein